MGRLLHISTENVNNHNCEIYAVNQKKPWLKLIALQAMTKLNLKMILAVWSYCTCFDQMELYIAIEYIL